MDECFLCRKHRGQEPAPPGGYVFESRDWKVCHAPVDKGPLGMLFIESTRHFLDFAEFSEQESKSFIPLVRQVYGLLRQNLGAARIYQVSMMEGIPHFHVWIIPRVPEISERGVAFLALDLTCTESAAAELAVRLRAALMPG